MCTIIILNGVHERWPLVVAANRDEFFMRPSSGPQVLTDMPRSVGGRDEQAGGTWMAVSPSGFFAGLTNQRAGGERDDALKSRGEVVVDLMRRGTVPSARCWITGVDPTAYNPFNVVYGTPGDVWVSHSSDKLKPKKLSPGVSVLPNERLNSSNFPKVERARTLCRQLPNDDDAFFAHLMKVLADQLLPEEFPEFVGSDLPSQIQSRLHALQVKTPQYGTCSSTIFAVSRDGETRYLFADGPPDEASFVDYSQLL